MDKFLICVIRNRQNYPPDLTNINNLNRFREIYISQLKKMLINKRIYKKESIYFKYLL